MSNRPWQVYLDDILDAAEAVISYTEGISFSSFCDERMRQSAVIREFLIIGEAIGKLPDTVKAQEQQIPWQDIRDFRNLLVHEYFGIDLEIVWSVIQEDLPPLIGVLKQLKTTEF